MARMIGRRLPVVDGKLTMPERPGDYCGPVTGYTGDKPAVFFLKPNARDEDAPVHARSVQHVTSPPHTFTEGADGSLTVSPSIGDTRSRQPELGSDGWHGYLEHGVWRQV
jgi:hypothetical protein